MRLPTVGYVTLACELEHRWEVPRYPEPIEGQLIPGVSDQDAYCRACDKPGTVVEDTPIVDEYGDPLVL